MLVTRLAAHIS